MEHIKPINNGVTMKMSQNEVLQECKIFEQKIREVIDQTDSLSDDIKGNVLLTIEEELHQVGW